MYNSTYGKWKVTTEGDCEGRTVRDLGVYKGYVDEIALYLADKQFYGLTFKLTTEQPKKLLSKRESVNVKFDIDSDTWNLSEDELVYKMKKFFKNRPVFIKKSNYFASFTISTEKDTIEKDKLKALSKLNDYEKEILNIEE